MISSCAPKFDQTVYLKIVDLVVVSRDAKQFCEKVNNDPIVIDSILNSILYAETYTRGFQNDNDVDVILLRLISEIDRFKKLRSLSSISPDYCISKINNIHATSLIALYAQGGKSK
jgi:hypothetical protein